MILLTHLGNIKIDKNLDNEYYNSNITLMLNVIKQSSILDSSGQMIIVHNIFGLTSSQSINSNDITLVTHSSLSSIYHLPFLAKRWQGYISIAIFSLAESLDLTIQAILFFAKCYPSLAAKISIHLVFPLHNSSHILAHLSASSLKLNSFASFKCNHFKLAITSQVYHQNYNHGFDYPNNLLRNVAASNVFTKFQLIVDIDLVPSYNLKKNFINYIHLNQLENDSIIWKNHEDEKTVYILPVFEVNLDDNKSEEQSIPKDKKSLLKMVEQGECRPFYFELCWKCQKYTNYELWSLNSNNDDDFKNNYKVKWHDPWEPFFISRIDAPKYDERFRQYGFNRISQVRG